MNMPRVYTRTPAIDRFLTRVDKTATCWIWTGGKSQNGYGCFKADPTTMVRAHRWSYEHYVGPIPDGLILMHSCDVPACVNPAHLTPGTQSENQQDMVKKGRIGERRLANGKAGSRRQAKLTPETAAEIRAKYATGEYTHRSLAAEYGVGHTTIRYALSGRTWQD